MLRDIIEKIKGERIYKDAIEVLSEEFYSNDEDYPDESYRLEDFYWKSGACKICILFSDFVLKTTFKGYIDEGEDFLEYISYEDFGSDGSILKNAKTEYLIYQAAIKEGLERFFVETIQITDNIFAQERVDQVMFEITNVNVTAETARFCLKYKVPFCSRVMQMLFNSGETEESILKLLDFLQRFDVDDLHNGNIGIIDRKVKFFDFAGFCTNSADIVEKWVSSDE